MPEMIKAGDLRVGDKFRIEATVTEVGTYLVYTNRNFTVQTRFEVELTERAMPEPEFEPGGILRYCHDPINFPNDYVDWFIAKKNQAVQLNSIHYVTRPIYCDANVDDTDVLSVNIAPNCWTYFPPATTNDNGTRLG